MRIFDIFCDASVTNSLRGACAGAFVSERFTQGAKLYINIQPQGTNNSGEIAAIMQGIIAAINIRYAVFEPCRFNIFSDSIISIKGIREWMFQWLNTANKSGTTTFTSSSGTPVANQIYFKTIFNLITLNGIELFFYHQKGHVDGRYREVATMFEKINGISLMRLGLTPEYISACNNYIDMKTRAIIHRYFDMKDTDNLLFCTDIDIECGYNILDTTIMIDNDQPSFDESINFPIFCGKSFIQQYATLIHAMEYPSANKIAKYIS